MMRMMDAQLVHAAQKKCTGATRHPVDQLIMSLQVLIKVHNSPKCANREVVAAKIDHLEQVLHALAHR